MRVLVCGGRDYVDREHVWRALDDIHAAHGIDLLIDGGASGADALARQWAVERRVRGWTFMANWEAHGRAAGPIRNSRMLVEGKPDLVVAFSGGAGTRSMVRKALAAGVQVMRQDMAPEGGDRREEGA